MQRHQCERCGSQGTLRMERIGVWTCVACAAAIRSARSHMPRQSRDGVTSAVVHAALRRAELHARSHLRMS